MKLVQLVCLVLLVLFLSAAPAMATPGDTAVLSGSSIAGGLGMGLTIIGAGWGLGRIGAAAVEGMARQPEAAARIQTAMIIVAAMLEGASLFSVVLCAFVVGSKGTF
jgi:F-type H+-transporting ATPase subunit c